MRLIDAEELSERIYKYFRGLEHAWGKDQAQYWADNFCVLVDDSPTAETVRRGHWEYNPKDAFEVMFELPKCSVCGHESSDALNYCPSCGAKMDEVSK